MNIVFVVTATHGSYSDCRTSIDAVFTTKDKAQKYCDDKNNFARTINRVGADVWDKHMSLKRPLLPQKPKNKLINGNKKSEAVWNDYNNLKEVYNKLAAEFDLKLEKIVEEELIKAGIYTSKLLNEIKSCGYSFYSFDIDYDIVEMEVDKINAKVPE
ncbi:MAG: hypothetical protein LC122_02440 [Chitinophagales bacterium]|nr:hypothetical protein [Chitinophagales bacterium]